MELRSGDKCIATECDLGSYWVNSVTFTSAKVHTKCLVCGGDVEVDIIKSYGSHLCDECRCAILKMREEIK